MTNPFDGIRAVLFDLDGTLVDTNIDFALMRREMMALGARHGVPASELQGLDILAMVDAIVAGLDQTCEHEKASEVRGEAFEILERIEIGHCGEAEPIPGAREILEALRDAGIGIGIVTRNSRSAVALSLSRTGIAGDVLLTRDDVPRTKPAPGHLLRALSLLGVSPDEALMVGDHWMDVQGGRAAGIRTVGFLRSDRPDDFFDCERPDVIVRSLAELIEHLRRLKK